MQDSPNPKGVMSSKASGEPSLLLSTSVLYALRHAVDAARHSLNSLGTSVQAVDWSSSLDSTGVSQADCKSRQNNSFFVLAAPATVVKIKQVYSLLLLPSQLFTFSSTNC